MKKIYVASDIHGSYAYLKKFWQVVDLDSTDKKVVLLGDTYNHGPRNPFPEEYAPMKVESLLEERMGDFLLIKGNCDSEVDQMMLEYPMMSDYATLLADGHRFFLTHGHHWNPSQLPPLGAGDVLCYGHTHIPQAERITDGLTAFNPGSLSLPKGGYAASYGTYENNTLTVWELESGNIIFQTVLS